MFEFSFCLIVEAYDFFFFFSKNYTKSEPQWHLNSILRLLFWILQFFKTKIILNQTHIDVSI